MTTNPPRQRPTVRARRRAKNHWTYDCATCGYVHNSVDEFGAYEAGWHHVRSTPHLGKAMGEALATLAAPFKAIAEAFKATANTITDAFNGLALPIAGTEWHSILNPRIRVRIMEADMDAMVVSYRHIDSLYRGQRGIIGFNEFIGPKATFARIPRGN